MAATGSDYVFAPHEQPFLPGSPATPAHPMPRRIGYFAMGTLLAQGRTLWRTRPWIGHAIATAIPLIAFAALFVLGPVVLTGIFRALAHRPNHIVSFSALFGITQTLGGLAGTALLGTFQIMRERYHSVELVQGLTAADPLAAVKRLAEQYRALGGAASRWPRRCATRPIAIVRAMASVWRSSIRSDPCWRSILGLVQLQADQLNTRVSLYQAMGGGWTVAGS